MLTRSSETFDTVQSILAQQFGLPNESITVDAELVDLGLDSLTCIKFALSLETMLARDIDDKIVLQWKTVQDVVNAIEAWEQ